MSRHTTGPWEFVDNALVGPKIDNKPIWLRPVILRSEVGVSQHNARLIASAPDLLEACIKTIEENGHLADGDSCTLIHLLRAIEKATGETP